MSDNKTLRTEYSAQFEFVAIVKRAGGVLKYVAKPRASWEFTVSLNQARKFYSEASAAEYCDEQGYQLHRIARVQLDLTLLDTGEQSKLEKALAEAWVWQQRAEEERQKREDAENKLIQATLRVGELENSISYAEVRKLKSDLENWRGRAKQFESWYKQYETWYNDMFTNYQELFDKTKAQQPTRCKECKFWCLPNISIHPGIPNPERVCTGAFAYANTPANFYCSAGKPKQPKTCGKCPAIAPECCNGVFINNTPINCLGCDATRQKLCWGEPSEMCCKLKTKPVVGIDYANPNKVHSIHYHTVNPPTVEPKYEFLVTVKRPGTPAREYVSAVNVQEQKLEYSLVRKDAIVFTSDKAAQSFITKHDEQLKTLNPLIRGIEASYNYGKHKQAPDIGSVAITCPRCGRSSSDIPPHAGGQPLVPSKCPWCGFPWRED